MNGGGEKVGLRKANYPEKGCQLARNGSFIAAEDNCSDEGGGGGGGKPVEQEAQVEQLQRGQPPRFGSEAQKSR